MSKLSFIIPVYNGEKYVERCLKSIFVQNFDDIEIIMVNDGSTDKSVERINEVSKKYNRKNYNVIVHTQENGGIAAARNKGIELATSEYIAFIDQDDYIVKKFCDIFRPYIEDRKYDMVIGGFCRKDNHGKLIRKMIPCEEDWSKYNFTYPWGRIIRRDFLVNNDIKFLKTSIGEDVYFDLVAYSYSKKIITIPYCTYVWYYNAESVSNTQYTKVDEAVNPIYTFDCVFKDLAKDNKIPKDYFEYYFIKFIVWYLLSSARQSKGTESIKLRNILFEWLQKNFPKYKKNVNLFIGRPKGETFFNRLCVKGYMFLHLLNLDKLLLKIL